MAALEHVQGTWGIGNFKLPDFGVTELLRMWAGKTPSAEATTTFNNPNVIRATMGSTAPYSSQNTSNNQIKTNIQTTTNTGGSGGGGGGSNPQPQGTNQPQEDPMARIRAEVESIYAPLMNYYSQAESSITEEYNRYKPELEQQYQTSLSNIQTEKAKGERELAQQQEQAVARREDALSAARRLYDELRRGGRQRFGGASSAGQAYTELTNVEQQRQAGNIWNLYQQAESQITKYKADLADRFDQAFKELELAKTSALNQAYSDYQNRLNQIRAMKAQTESAKAQTALQELYNLRNQVNQINLTTLNLAQQLAANKQMAFNYVDNYAKRVAANIMGGRGVYESFLGQTTTNPQSNLTIGGRTTTASPNSYQGYINYKKPEDYLKELGY